MNVGFHTWMSNVRINEPIPDSWKGVPARVAIESGFVGSDVNGFPDAPTVWNRLIDSNIGHPSVKSNIHTEEAS